jgi:hypothetical protein
MSQNCPLLGHQSPIDLWEDLSGRSMKSEEIDLGSRADEICSVINLWMICPKFL